MATTRVRMSVETRQRVVEMSVKQGMSEKEIYEKLKEEGTNVRLVAIKQLLTKYQEFGYVSDKPRTHYGQEIMDTIQEVTSSFHGEWVSHADVRDIVRDLTGMDIPTETIGRLRRKLGHKLIRTLVFDPEYYEVKRLEKELLKKMKERENQSSNKSTSKKPTRQTTKKDEPDQVKEKSKKKVSDEFNSESKELKPAKSVQIASSPESESLAFVRSNSASVILANRKLKQSSINTYFQRLPTTTANNRRVDIVNSRKLRTRSPRVKTVS